MMRYLAIDLGQKRTGLAIGDDETRVVTPLDVIEHARQELLLQRVVDWLEREQIDAVVVGLPLNMDGTRGQSARRAEKFSIELGRRTSRPVHLTDERLSSTVADEQMAQSGLTHGQKRLRRDALAAATILRDFLEGLKQ